MIRQNLPNRSVLIPDLDEEIIHALTAAEELLIAIGDTEDAIYAVRTEQGPAAAEPVPPTPLAGRAALATVRRLWDVIAPTQGERAKRAGHTRRLLAPDGRYEHLPVRAVEIDPADVATLSTAARALGDPHAPSWLRELIDDLGGDLYEPYQRTPGAGGRLVMAIAQLGGILDLADTAETTLLRECLAAHHDHAGPAADLVLTTEQEAAYRTTVDRINHMWTLADPTQRWKY